MAQELDRDSLLPLPSTSGGVDETRVDDCGTVGLYGSTTDRFTGRPTVEKAFFGRHFGTSFRTLGRLR